MQECNIQYKVNMLNNNQLKINVEEDVEYRELTKAINNAKLEWHSYESKLTRPIKVMARNLHPTCESQDIKEELKTKGFKVLDVINKYKRETKDGKVSYKRLPLFMLTFENSEDINKIFKISHIQHMKVKIEALRKSNLIPQCKKCQRFGHTKAFCGRPDKYVRCAGPHLTINCKQEKNAPAKCANCLGAHLASYRGCLVAKEIQKRKQKATVQKKIQLSSDHTPKSTKTPQSYKVVNEVSYAKVAQFNNNGQSSRAYKINSITTPRKVAQINNNRQSSKAYKIDNITSPSHVGTSSIISMMQKMVTTMDEISQRLNLLEMKYNDGVKAPKRNSKNGP